MRQLICTVRTMMSLQILPFIEKMKVVKSKGTTQTGVQVIGINTQNPDQVEATRKTDRNQDGSRIRISAGDIKMTADTRKLELLVEKNDIAAITELAEIYMYDMPMNKEKAVDLFKKGAALGDPYLTWSLGDALYYGEGIEESIEEAIKYYETAASLGQAEAMTALGVYYINDALDAPNFRKAIPYYQQAANLGEPNAFHNLGVCYSNGSGVERNDSKAYALFLAAAKLDHEEAQFKVGWSLANGAGTTEDIKKAKVWLRKAAESGNVEAQKLLTDLDN
ncbi:MAG: sel1 repeat family protein [Candidatus Thiodiazotropha sp. (ex Dulcina madagascariensis)]|nr:sel1 repeat family protein [Candidatus Thiodiazotropha sp. (ex Dulcina madagascariensis)]